MEQKSIKLQAREQLEKFLGDDTEYYHSTDTLYKDLPEYTRKLLQDKGFENLFLAWNPRYLTKGYIEYLPTFGTKEDDGEYWHGKLMWRFVGWHCGDKYPPERLRQIRKERLKKYEEAANAEEE